MSRLIILIAIGVVAWLIYKLYYQKLRQQGKPGMLKLGLIVLGLVFMALAVTGRAHILFALIGAALTQVMRIMPLLIRFFPAFQQMFNSTRPFGGTGKQRSNIRTQMLNVWLDHDTGQIDGDITQGRFTGRKLSQLSREELAALSQECEQSDPEGVRLLQAFVSRSFGEQGNEHQHDSAANHDHGVTSIAEAREILGVSEQASREDIVASHRRLMGKLHPDKGGSTYLAAKINAAKDVLLEQLKRERA